MNRKRTATKKDQRRKRNDRTRKTRGLGRRTLGNTCGEERQIAARWMEQRGNVSGMTMSVATSATKSHCARRNAHA